MRQRGHHAFYTFSCDIATSLYLFVSIATLPVPPHHPPLILSPLPLPFPSLGVCCLLFSSHMLPARSSILTVASAGYRWRLATLLEDKIHPRVGSRTPFHLSPPRSRLRPHITSEGTVWFVRSTPCLHRGVACGKTIPALI